MAEQHYGPIITFEQLRVALKDEKFHPRLRLRLQTFVLLTSNENIEFLCQLINIAGECHDQTRVSDPDGR